MNDQTQKEDPKPVSMSCANPKCDSIQAVQIPMPKNVTRIYRCVKCNMIKSAMVGGNVNLNDL